MSLIKNLSSQKEFSCPIAWFCIETLCSFACSYGQMLSCTIFLLLYWNSRVLLLVSMAKCCHVPLLAPVLKQSFSFACSYVKCWHVPLHFTNAKGAFLKRLLFKIWKHHQRWKTHSSQKWSILHTCTLILNIVTIAFNTFVVWHKIPDSSFEVVYPLHLEWLTFTCSSWASVDKSKIPRQVSSIVGWQHFWISD